MPSVAASVGWWGYVTRPLFFAPSATPAAGPDPLAVRRHRLRLGLGLTLLGVGYALTVQYLFVVHPLGYAVWICEDNAAEYGTSMCFLAAAGVVGLAGLLRPGWAAKLAAALMAFGLFALGMEEISWGQRILGIETPEALRSVNLQEEITLHNLATPGMVVHAMIALIAGWLAVSGLCALRPGLWKWLEGWGAPLARPTTAGLFAVVVAMLLWEPTMNYQEATEFLLGVAVLAWAIDRAVRQHAGRLPGPALAVALVLVAGVFVVGSTYVLTVKRPGWNGWIMNRLAAEAYAHAGHHDAALVMFTHLQSNPKLMMPHTRLAHAATLDALGLDVEAKNTLYRALPYHREAAENQPTALNLRYLGQCYRQIGHDDLADRYLAQALAVDEAALAEAEDPDTRAELTWSIARTQEWTEGVRAAEATSDRALSMTDSVTLRAYIVRWQERHLGTGLPWIER